MTSLFLICFILGKMCSASHQWAGISPRVSADFQTKMLPLPFNENVELTKNAQVEQLNAKIEAEKKTVRKRFTLNGSPLAAQLVAN